MTSQRPLFISIRTAVPTREQADAWGDHHFALSLARHLQALGHYARVDCKEHVRASNSAEMDAVLTIRGRISYSPEKRSLNLLWVISHPEMPSDRELASYDHVFIASHAYADVVRTATRTPVSVLSQATDPSLFRARSQAEITASHVPSWPVLFVGNSRKVYRPIVRDCIRQGIDLAVYGSSWEQLIPARYIKGTHIPNDQLALYYASCGILLNDHWDTMRANGFISNRLYDASACGAFVLTDPVQGLEKELPNSHDVVRNARELAEKVEYYLAHPDERRRRAERAREQVLAQHTFAHRAQTIVDTIEDLLPELRERRRRHPVGERARFLPSSPLRLALRNRLLALKRK